MIYVDSGREAKLAYSLSSFRVVKPGDYVLCAVTGRRIPIGNLRYWSHERQEAYADAVIATRRYEESR